MDGSLKELIKNKIYLRNLIIMTFIWSFGSFAFFLVPFYVTSSLKGIGNIYFNLLFNYIAELLACLVILLVIKYMKLKTAATLFSVIILIGSILMTVLIEIKKETDKDGGSTLTNILSATFIMITNFGVVCVFDIAYLINPTLFPTILLASCYGICNLFGRFITIFSPLVADLGPLPPLLILIVFSAATVIGTRLLVILKEDPD